ncbi:MAG: hypothetical protein AAF216_13850 [Pseudomonadota bacterium]
MRPSRLMSGLRCPAAVLVAMLMLGGCTLLGGPSELMVTASANTDAQPIASPAELEDVYVRQGPRFNQLGGEVPKAAPSPDVDEADIGEIISR